MGFLHISEIFSWLRQGLWIFSVHKSEISKFIAWIHMEYFHVGIFVIPGVCLIRKYGSRKTAFFSVFQSSSGCRDFCIVPLETHLFFSRTGWNLSLFSTFAEKSWVLSCKMSNLEVGDKTHFIIDNIQQWKMQEIWNPLHVLGQTYHISKRFSNFEQTTSKNCPFFKCSSALQTKT